MPQLYGIFYIFQLQKRLVVATIIQGNTVYTFIQLDQAGDLDYCSLNMFKKSSYSDNIFGIPDLTFCTVLADDFEGTRKIILHMFRA